MDANLKVDVIVGPASRLRVGRGPGASTSRPTSRRSPVATSPSWAASSRRRATRTPSRSTTSPSRNPPPCALPVPPGLAGRHAGVSLDRLPGLRAALSGPPLGGPRRAASSEQGRVHEPARTESDPRGVLRRPRGRAGDGPDPHRDHGARRRPVLRRAGRHPARFLRRRAGTWRSVPVPPPRPAPRGQGPEGIPGGACRGGRCPAPRHAASREGLSGPGRGLFLPLQRPALSRDAQRLPVLHARHRPTGRKVRAAGPRPSEDVGDGHGRPPAVRPLPDARHRARPIVRRGLPPGRRATSATTARPCSASPRPADLWSC